MTPGAIQALLRPFYGYLELGMDADANDALEALPDDINAHPLVYGARLELLMVMERWEEGVILGRSMCRAFPKIPKALGALKRRWSTTRCTNLSETAKPRNNERAPLKLKGLSEKRDQQ